MTEAQRYFDRLEAIRKKVLEFVAGMSDDLLYYRPRPEGWNSIAMVLQHLAGMERHWVGEVCGGISAHRDRSAEFTEQRQPLAQLVAAIDAAQERSRQVLTAMADVELDTVVSWTGTAGQRTTMRKRDVLDGLVVGHYYHHYGQLIYLKKLHGLGQP